MTVGVWMVPVMLAGLFVFLWAAGWFELLVALPGGDPELPMLKPVETGFTDACTGPESPGVDGRVGAEFAELANPAAQTRGPTHVHR